MVAYQLERDSGYENVADKAIINTCTWTSPSVLIGALSNYLSTVPIIHLKFVSHSNMSLVSSV